MGRRAYRDVYPMVRAQVDKVTRGGGYRYTEPEWDGDWRGRLDGRRHAREGLVTRVGEIIDKIR